MTFWDHLDELRRILINIAILTLVMMVAAFLCKDLLFHIVLAPNDPEFITYRLIDTMLNGFGGNVSYKALSIQMISTSLTSQFVVHLRMALYAGLLLASPYMVFLLFKFIAPGLYENEKYYVRRIVVWAWLSFFIGLLLNYYVVFPFSLQFLAGYHVSDTVVNMFTINSYIDTFVLLGLMMGILFELPVVAWLLAELGVLNVSILKHYRRHAIMLIVTITALITPSTDIFTLLLVSCPIYLLYELSIAIVSGVEHRRTRIA